MSAVWESDSSPFAYGDKFKKNNSIEEPLNLLDPELENSLTIFCHSQEKVELGELDCMEIQFDDQTRKWHFTGEISFHISQFPKGEMTWDQIVAEIKQHCF